MFVGLGLARRADRGLPGGLPVSKSSDRGSESPCDGPINVTNPSS